jgi:hypothetical protein
VAAALPAVAPASFSSGVFTSRAWDFVWAFVARLVRPSLVVGLRVPAVPAPRAFGVATVLAAFLPRAPTAAEVFPVAAFVAAFRAPALTLAAPAPLLFVAAGSEPRPFWAAPALVILRAVVPGAFARVIAGSAAVFLASPRFAPAPLGPVAAT